MRVSIALATYNGGRFLAEQLASLQAQVAPPFELVVGDDGSTDDTAAIVAAFAAEAAFPVRFHRNIERLGYRANFMRCAERCAGDLIAFCDQDDIWLPHKLATQMRHFEDARVQLSCHPVRLMQADGRAGARVFDMIGKTGVFRLTELQPFAWTNGLTQVFRRDLLRYTPLWATSCDPDRPHEIAAHDQWFFFLAALQDGVFHGAEPLVLYRQHAANVFGAPSEAGSRVRVDAAFLVERERQYRDWVLACRSRIACLEAMHEPAQRQAMLMAQRHYGQALAVISDRLEFYQAATVGQRATLLARNLARGHYARWRHPWNLGLRSVVRDVATVALIPRRTSPAVGTP